MVDLQIPLPGLARDFNTLTTEERDFIQYFAAIDNTCSAPVTECYGGIGPQGYGASLILARMIKVKERILSDRQLAKVLRQHDLYRFVTNNIQPSHTTFNTLRKRLGPPGFIEIHKRFVHKAHRLGLLDIEISTLPKNRKPGIFTEFKDHFICDQFRFVER